MGSVLHGPLPSSQRSVPWSHTPQVPAVGCQFLVEEFEELWVFWEVIY